MIPWLRAVGGAVVPNYFVDSAAGNDGNDGKSEGAAWATIAKVNATAFLPGDVIGLKGTFNTTTLNLGTSSNGTASNPIVVTSYGGGQATVSGTGNVYAIQLQNKNFITITNLAVTQSDGVTGGNSVILLDNADDCVISDCTITGNQDALTAGGAGINIQGGSQRFDVDNCTITDTAWHNIYINEGQGTELNGKIRNCTLGTHAQRGVGDMIQFGNTCGDNVTVDNCTFDNQNNANGENGIDVKAAGHVISNCTFTQTRQSAILVQEGSGVGTATSVTLNDNTINCDIQNGGRAVGVDDDATAVFNRCKFVCNGTAANELVRISVGASAGTDPTATFNACAFEIPTGETATRIFDIRRGSTVTLDNCTLLSRNGNTLNDIVLAHSTLTGTITIRNSVLDTDGTTNLILHSDVADPFTLQNNLYESGATNWFDINGTLYDEADVPATYGGANSDTGDPLFDSEDVTNANYLLPQTGSPALDLGSNAFNPATDLVGTSYDDPPNAGCREGNA